VTRAGQSRLTEIARRLTPSISESPALLGLGGVALGARALDGRYARRLTRERAIAERATADAMRAEAEAEEARARVWMLEQVGEVVRALLDSPHPREEVCRAAIELGGAHAAIIYEPRVGDVLTCTAMSGLQFGDREVTIDAVSRARRAYDSGRPVFVAGAREDRVSSRDLWRAAGRPASILYQPMARGGRSLGVLAVGWREVLPFDGSSCAAVALLAHEAAAVIAHADAVDSLTGQTRTDPLTGLANQRGFEAALAAALESGATVTVAKFDVDAFAAYNDAFGYPAGDRTLRSCAAGWRSALRAGDLMARVDADVFSLLLVDCEATAAVRIVERLRGAVTDEQTCSAGLAARRIDETGPALLARVDGALAAAKGQGRNRLSLGDDID
jgi:diguanylate cyclase (GGDEF)-like protein